MASTKMKVLCKANKEEWDNHSDFFLESIEFEKLLKEKQYYKVIASFEFTRNKVDEKRHKMWREWKQKSKSGLEILRRENNSSKILFMVTFRNSNTKCFWTLLASICHLNT
uniref:Uncharacterized protein n=1 Tax=Globodera pallida TaxID=36090 RepID=A0A183C1D3_GLOPA